MIWLLLICLILLDRGNGAQITARASWSNRLGATLTPVATGVWAAERQFLWNGIDVGGRSVIARMPKRPGEEIGKLFVHSPVEWTPELAIAIERLGGEVGACIAPNYEHLKFIEQWADRYPTASTWACPGLPSRMPHVRWTNEFDDRDDNTPDGFERFWFDCELNPFTGRPFFNEVVFFHKQSRALLVTDVFWNYPDGPLPNYFGNSGTGSVHDCPKAPVDATTLPAVDVPVGTRAWKAGMDRIYLPFYKNLMVGRKGPRRERYNQLVEKLLGIGIELIVPCHGDVVRGADLCADVLRKSLL